MKQNLYNPIVMSMLIGILFLTNSCQDLFNDPLKDKDTGEDLALLLLDTDFFDTKITVSLEDTLGNPVNDQEVLIAFLGQSASDIVNLKGEKKETFSTTNGVLEVAVDPNVDISEASPFSFFVFAGTEDNSWIAFPKEVEIIKKGYAEVVMKLISTSQTKSASLSPGNEPFDVKFNGEVPTRANGWWLYSREWKDGRLHYYTNLYPWGDRDISGTLTASNITTDPKLFKDYGFLQSVILLSYHGQDLTLMKSSTVNYSLGLPHHPEHHYYTALIRTDVEKCESGININVEEKYGQKGSAKFSYTLSAGKIPMYDYSIEKEEFFTGKINSNILPATINTGTFYYPFLENNGRYNYYYESNKIYLKITGDSQYDIEPSEIELTNFCGTTVNVKAVPKSGLKPYRIVTSFVCEDNPLGAAPTISGTFMEIGSTDNPTSFSFSKGVAILQLKPGKSYSIVGNAFGETASFDFPTDESKISAVISEALTKITELKSLSITFSEITKTTEDDPFLGTQINIQARFKDGHCPL